MVGRRCMVLLFAAGLTGCVAQEDNSVDLRGMSHQMVLNVGFLPDMDIRTGPWLFDFGGEAQIRPQDAGDAVLREARMYSQKGIELSEVTVRIEFDSGIPDDVVQNLIKLCQDAGFETFTMPHFEA